jgi:hypothetical protein
MASDAQIRANQANAQLSTGPRSPEGKERVSQNARRHGLNSHVILPEDQPEFDALVFRGGQPAASQQSGRGSAYRGNRFTTVSSTDDG